MHSNAILGIDGIPLSVEVDCYPGLSKFTIVGLPDLAVKESQERVSSAIRNSGFRVPRGVNVVNLAPADIRKEGSALDLPIAIGLLAASEQISGSRLLEYAIIGELALNGGVRAVPGVLPMALAVREQGLRGLLLPAENGQEAGVVPGVEAIPVASLNEAVAFMCGTQEIAPFVTNLAGVFEHAKNRCLDVSDVKGQAYVKRALTVAAAGGHNLLMIGPPGTGKTMLASRLPGIMPDMTFVDVPALSFEELTQTKPSGLASAEIKANVQAARNRQRERYNGKFACNAHLDAKAVRQYCVTDGNGSKLLEAAMTQLGLSARAYDKVLRIARTLADLDASEGIAENHVAEAIQYRTLDRALA